MSVHRSTLTDLVRPPIWDDGQAPGWFAPTIQTLEDLLRLPENWNSYGARPIIPELAGAALKLLLDTASADTPAPIVVPTVRGGILLEWHMRGIDLEIETLGRDQFHVFYEDARAGGDWEGDLIGDVGPVPEFLVELSRGA